LTTVIFVNLDAVAFSRVLRVAASEWAIVVAASLANYLVDQRQAVGLASNGLDRPTAVRCWSIPPRMGRVHLMKLLEWLARVQLAETTALADWLPLATAGLPWEPRWSWWPLRAMRQHVPPYTDCVAPV